jgi:hypothetical protein
VVLLQASPLLLCNRQSQRVWWLSHPRHIVVTRVPTGSSWSVQRTAKLLPAHLTLSSPLTRPSL